MYKFDVLGTISSIANNESTFQDRGNPEAAHSSFNDVPFDAKFASSSSIYHTVSQMPGVDGFTMNVDPLYKVMTSHGRSATVGTPKPRRLFGFFLSFIMIKL